jgi:hypothetical protein
VKSITPILCKFAFLLGVLGLSACSTQLPPSDRSAGEKAVRELSARVRASPQLAVIFIGNSYSFGVPKEFSKVAHDQGKSVRVGHATYGGWSLSLHAENEATLRKIREGNWDIVVIQERSDIPSMSARKRVAMMDPPLHVLASLARQHGAIPVLYQTWGRRDGDKNVWFDSFQAMTRRLRVGYQAAARNEGGLVVAPVGDAWEREIHTGRASELFMSDGSHPTAIGNQVTANVFYQTFFER